jgi:hypothetical protein
VPEPKPAPVEGEGEGEGEGEEAEAEPEPPAPKPTNKFKYIDDARNVVFELDVVTGEVELISDSYIHSNGDVQALKEEVISQLETYMKEDYKVGASLATVFVDGDQDLTLRVNISCHNLNLSNFWGGEWLSTWDIMHSLGDPNF